MGFDITDGVIKSTGIITDIYSQIEKGVMKQVNAIVLHQSGSSNSESVYASYKSGQNGAHFLIEKNGSIVQTARINRKCWHVGAIRSKCYELKNCSIQGLNEVQAVLFKQGQSYALRVKKLNQLEATKAYPDRYPTNDDSIGIEIVGAFDLKLNQYEMISREQNRALAWLIDLLQTALQMDDNDIYRHPEVSYKKPSEAQSAKWR